MTSFVAQNTAKTLHSSKVNKTCSLTMALLVTNLAGAVMAELSPVPKSIQEARAEVERASGVPAALQKLVREGQVLTEDAELPEEFGVGLGR